GRGEGASDRLRGEARRCRGGGGPVPGTAAVVRGAAPDSKAGAADGGAHERGRGGAARGHGAGRVRRGGRRGAVVAAPWGPDLRGQSDRQPVVRAAGGGGGAGPQLLRGRPAGVRGRRPGVQLGDPPRVLPGLRADRGPAARGLLPVPGGAGERGGGRALAAVPGVAAGLLAGAGRRSDRGD